MKVKYAGLVLLGVLILTFAVSCKSAPPPEVVPPPPEKEVLDEASLKALEAAEDRALAAQKLISDFNGNTAFPDDWKSATALLAEADRRKTTSTNQEIKDSTERYINAAKAFEGMTGKTMERYYGIREAALVSARNEAVAAGADELIPEFLGNADAKTASAVKKYEAADYYGARAEADNALTMYGLLKSGLEAYDIRYALAERNFEEYDPVNIAKADDTLRDAANAYTAGDFKTTKEKIEAAKAAYTESTKIAWLSFAAEKGAEAADGRQMALNERANVASRQEFNAAQDMFNRANAAFRDQRFNEAASGFEESIKRFEAVVIATRLKRAAAEQALEKANQKMAESDEKARSAEIILEGGEE